MRLVTFEVDGSTKVGVVLNDRVITLTAADSTLPPTMLELLGEGEAGMARAQAVLAAPQAESIYALSSVRLRAPLSNPGKIICIGQNYRDHVLEQNAAMPEKPIIFAKFTTSIVGPEDDVIYPTTTQELDYEAELVVVIGKRGKHIARADAYTHIAGYMIGQDVTARDLQRGDGQWVRGKAQDTSAPLGPYLVTGDEIPDPQDLSIKLWVNGDERQSSHTSNLIFDVPTLVEFISQGITLLPGDIIFTGTPPGVGAFRKPVPQLLQVGDEMVVEIERLGRLVNRIVADPDA